jgi:hypothetical protein
LTAGQSVFTNHIFGKLSPEVTTSDGYVDYRVRGDEPIALELKSAFTQKTNAEDDITSLEFNHIDWRNHQEQVEKYRTNSRFTILTNLKEWYFFSNKDPEPINDEPYDLKEFLSEFELHLSISDYLIRLSHQQSKPDLDDKFLESLESWVDKLLSTEYAVDVDDSDRIDEVVNFINKFIFIQTLDDYSVVEFNWIKNTWEYNRRRWSNYNERKFAESFIADVREWFYKHYDTELFRHEVIQHIPDRNIDEFCDLLGEVLGLYERQSDTSIKRNN